MAVVISSISVLPGAIRVNQELGLAAYEDPAGKLAWIISTVNALVTAVSALEISIQTAMLCAASFSSAFSTGSFGSTTTLLASAPMCTQAAAAL